MNKKDDGGSAFPQINQWDSDKIKMGESGMTLRDYFAAKAMQGIISASGDFGDVSYEDSAVAESAYEMADVMLKAREL